MGNLFAAEGMVMVDDGHSIATAVAVPDKSKR